MDELTASDIIELLDMAAHPEGGYYRETFRDEENCSTAIYYLLEGGDRSHWHRVHGSSEVWHYYAGDPLSLALSSDGHDTEIHQLGTNLINGERPQIVVPAGCWQMAESKGRWTLVGCTVAPGFRFENFELADRDWSPQP